MTTCRHSSTHPQLPPTTEEERFLWLRLLRSRRVGPATFHRLMNEHGSAASALAILPKIARDAGVTDYEICPIDWVEAELAKGHQAGAQLIAMGDAAFPQALMDLPDAPPMIWVKGDTRLLEQASIALVGARNASSLGTRMARALATELGAAGHFITSGLARGVDAAAHKAALKTGTIAVFAGGLDQIYPAENTNLAGQIADQGLILSEQPMGMQPQARHFPTRNRIISGLSRAIVVVEAAAKSGSLITAKNALDQGRDVYAVPGHPFDTRAAGCNMLIRDGAILVRKADDVLEALEPLAPSQSELPLDDHRPTTPPRDLQQINKIHGQILDRIGPSPVAEDQLFRDIPVPTHLIAPALTDLELRGQITRQAGGFLTRQ